MDICICDFGSAKFLKDKPNSPYVVSQYYRAPELFLNYEDYDYEVDVWAFGCIIGELIFNEPIFKGKTEGDQLIKILENLNAIVKENGWANGE